MRITRSDALADRKTKRASKAASFLARADQLFKVKEGRERAGLELGIRTGLAMADRDRSFLGNALHCMSLARIQLERGGVEEAYEPVHLLSCIAQAYEQLDRLVDAVSSELDQAEADQARRTRTRNVARAGRATEAA